MYILCCDCKILSLYLTFDYLFMCLALTLFSFNLLGIWGFMNLDVHFSPHIWKFFYHYFKNRPSIPFSPFSSGIPITYILFLLMLSHKHQRLFLLFHSFFSFCSNWLISNDLSLSSLIFPSALSSLLLKLCLIFWCSHCMCQLLVCLSACFFDGFCIFVELLILFMQCVPNLFSCLYVHWNF